MSIETFRERVNLKIFDSKDTVLLIFRILSSLVAVLGLGLIIYSIGFPQTDESRKIEIFFMKFLFAFYILNYFVRFLYTFEPAKFLRSTWLELVLVFLLIIEAFSTLIFNTPLIRTLLSAFGFGGFLAVYHILLQFILLILLIIDLAKASTALDLIKLEASTMFILSFIILILGGAFLLMLPEMTTDHMGSDWMPALFTATSASCVTGLIVVDTATYFSFKGQLVILILIQLGGLNIISFASFFASLYSKGAGIKHHSMMQDFFSSGSLLDAKDLLRQIIFMTLFIEAIGTIVIFSLWDPAINFSSFGQKLFYSIFHSVSAFNNAGFSLFTNNLYEPLVKHSYMLHLAVAGMIFFGSLGFSTIRDIFSIGSMRERMRLPWKKYQLSTQISLYSSVLLIAFGALVFFLIEKNHILSGQKSFEATVTSIFQSVTCRTAGFNTIDMSMLQVPTLILMVFLMFIGASSGSTGGGIKTSTFTLIMVSAIATLRGKRNLELFRHNIAWELLNKAFSIFIFSASFIFIATFILSILEPGTDILKLLFEEVSAFGTVGLSTGITANMSDTSKYIIIFSMFVGRIGTLTLGFALSKKVLTVAYRYPNAHFMIG
ncbi:MAG TPA: potassium transporter TrkG [Bacteroidia bacterium]|nr:potassium transporter TrkG [Bacteroidia bacterium]